jgi:serine/threonine-protein kinase
MHDFATGTAAWAVLNRLLDEALDLPPHERSRWLERLEPEYHSLRPRLSRLLAECDVEAGRGVDTIPKFDDATDEELRPAVVGPYEVLSKIADGGMGSVWLAHRTDVMVNRLVALKLPRGEWRSARLAERLAAEREILAVLNHPDIARLYDAGVSASGQPYLALEYIAGQPIDQYVQSRNMARDDRLRLIVRVARAVAYAHSRLVVHRDLKPSNILVADDGAVKLLDFGIAAILEGTRTAAAAHEPHACTPGYASPEQLAGKALGTATDIYSLGMVLFEILTGVRYTPDSRGRLPRGDLDAIAGQALAPEPDQRYATMDAFADDIERHLEHRPVKARRGDVWYRFGKRVVRHKVAVGAGAAVLAALLGGLVVAGWQARVAQSEKARAVEARDFLITLIQDANPFGASGRPLSAADWLMQAKERTDGELAERPELRVELLSVIGSSLASVQDADAADAVLRDAIDTGMARLGADHPQTLRARVRMTVVDRFKGRTKPQRAELDRLLPRLRAAGRPLAEDLSIALRSQAQLDVEEGRYDEAQRAADEAVDVTSRLLGESHAEYVVSLLLRAYVCYFSCDSGPALDAAHRAFRAVQTFYRAVPTHPRVIEGRYLLGRALAGAGDAEQGVHQLERAAAEAAQTLGPASRKVGVILFPLVRAQIDTGRVAEAVTSGRRAVEIIEREAEPASIRLATALHVHGAALLAASRVDEAIPELNRAVAIVRRALPPGHEVTRTFQADLALALARAGRRHEAEAFLIERWPAGTTPKGDRADITRMRALTAAGLAWLELGNPGEAATRLESALAISQRRQRTGAPDRVVIVEALERARRAPGRSEDARHPVRVAGARLAQ